MPRARRSVPRRLLRISGGSRSEITTEYTENTEKIHRTATLWHGLPPAHCGTVRRPCHSAGGGTVSTPRFSAIYVIRDPSARLSLRQAAILAGGSPLHGASWNTPGSHASCFA